MIKGKDGKEIFHAWKNWTLKEGAIPRIFQDCLSHLTKPKPAKRKLPKDRETADVRKHKNAKHLDEPREDINDIPLWVQFELIPGETTQSKSVHLKDGQVFLSYNSKVLYTTFLNQEQNDETLCQQLARVIKNFDEAHKCHGIREGKFANIKFCTGAVLQDDTWRSANCKTFFDVNNKNFYDPSSHSLPEDVLKWVQKTIEIGTPVCSECCTIRRALVKKVTQPNPISEKEKLTKLRADYRLAQQKIVRNN
ncbi:hypothetical protein GHT06_020407 [Daphnia sinensis]|uniref:Uncharacterized protein n=1 Tax=Daphnia sinensis TaxID=1820382 RepID=A0AAD5PP39_9CRUS|nr:hypothetical protein GHT06_020407 [Daphnia sinensis]